MPKWPFDEIADSLGVTDADWAEINRLKTAYETGGEKALGAAFEQLVADPIRAYRVVGALFHPINPSCLAVPSAFTTSPAPLPRVIVSLLAAKAFTVSLLPPPRVIVG